VNYNAPSVKKLWFFCYRFFTSLDEPSSAFHRTLFVFCCSNASCHSSAGAVKCFKVFRCQLPRSNPFYAIDPIPEAKAADAIVKGSPLCHLCGILGSKRCSKCKSINYCSPEHQVIDWKLGHKEECNELLANTPGRTPKLRKWSCLIKEFELINEDEPDSAEEQTNLDKETDLLKQYNKISNNTDDIEIPENTNKIDKTFLKFKQRISRSPEQVIRFTRVENPLWVTSSDQPSTSDIPNCPICKSPRVFEFQILPQLLNHLKLDKLDGPSIDWGTLAIYTCQKSCFREEAITKPYMEEFLWKQNNN